MLRIQFFKTKIGHCSVDSEVTPPLRFNLGSLSMLRKSWLVKLVPKRFLSSF